MSSRVCQIPEAAPATSALQPELGFCIWYVSATLVKRQALQNAMIIRYRATVLQAGAARPVYARFGQGLYSSLSLGISSEVFQAARTLKEAASLDAKPQQAVAVDAGPHVAAPAPWGRAAAAGLSSSTGTSSAGSLVPMPQPHTAVDAAADLRAAAAEAGSAATMVEQELQPAMAARPPSGSKRHAAQADKVVFADGEVKPAQVFAAMLDMSLEAFEAAVAEQNTAAFDFVGGFTAALKSWEENGMDDEDTPLIVRVVQQGFGYSVVSGSRFVLWSCGSVSFAGERVAADEVQVRLKGDQLMSIGVGPIRMLYLAHCRQPSMSEAEQVTGPIFDQACGPGSLTLPAILDLIAFEATLRPHREQQYVGWHHPDDAGQHGGSGHAPSSSGGGPSGPSYGGGGGSPGKNPRPLNAWRKQHQANGSDQQQADAPEQVSAWVHYPNLQLGQQLSRGRYAEVRLGVYYGQSAVIKLMSVEGWQPQSSYTWEGHVYKKCSNCQAIGAISILLGEGLTFAGQLYFIALTPAPGKALSALSKQELAATEGAAVQALQALHADGVLHGDLHADNIMVDLQAGKPPCVTLLDLGHSVLSHNKQAQDRELRHLRALISGT